MTLDRAIALGLAGAGALAYVAFGLGETTVYDYHARLGEALLAGRYWLSEAPSWLNELLACGPGRYCVVYPPLPAVLAAPLTLVFSDPVSQNLVAQLSGGASAGLLFLGLRAFGAPRAIAVSGALLSMLGTTLLFTSVDGRAWYAAHSVAMLFTSLAFWIAARGGSPLWLGAAIGLAALARLPVAAATPALALLLAHRAGAPYGRTLGLVVAAGLPFALLYLGYDLLRWGSLTETGYTRLIEGDVFFAHGLLSPLYIPRHLQAIFLETPDLVEGTPWFFRPRFIGMSLFIATPAFLWVFAGLRWVRRDVATAAVALAAGLALLPNILHGTVGFQQFGYRFSIDAQPYLIALAVAGDARADGRWRRWPSPPFIVAGLLSVVINVYAAIGIVRFGYWQ